MEIYKATAWLADVLKGGLDKRFKVIVGPKRSHPIAMRSARTYAE
jgi:hypothetical protein